MKKKGPFEWTLEADQAFQDLKKYLTSPPVMVAPRPLEPLEGCGSVRWVEDGVAELVG